MTAVEPAGVGSCDEKLAAIGAGASVGHGQAERLVSQFEVLILKARAVDGLAASTVSSGEVATLDHEVGDDAVEGAALVPQGAPILFDVAFAERDEVFDGFGDSGAEHVEDNVTGSSAADVDGEDDLVGDLFLNERESTLSRLQRDRASRVARRVSLNISIIHVKDTHRSLYCKYNRNYHNIASRCTLFQAIRTIFYQSERLTFYRVSNNYEIDYRLASHSLAYIIQIAS